MIDEWPRQNRAVTHFEDVAEYSETRAARTEEETSPASAHGGRHAPNEPELKLCLKKKGVVVALVCLFLHPPARRGLRRRRLGTEQWLTGGHRPCPRWEGLWLSQRHPEITQKGIVQTRV